MRRPARIPRSVPEGWEEFGFIGETRPCSTATTVAGDRFNPAMIAEQMPGVAGRTPFSPEAERERAFVDLAPYRDGRITLGKFSGASAWEIHKRGAEVVQVVSGEIVLRIAEHGTTKMAAGDTIVIPANSWHQIYAAKMAAVLYITPGTTEHAEGDITRPFDPLAGRGEWLLAGMMRLLLWFRRA